MAETTEIAWTDATFNPWIGCQKISPGCDHCYAEAQNAYRRWTQWGAHGERRRTSPANWRKPLAWHKDASAFAHKHGRRRRRVFCASLADVFDNAVHPSMQRDLFDLIKATPSLDWQLLTKRPQNIAAILPPDWGAGYLNVWLGITAEDQTRFDQRWPILREIPAYIRFISYEPAIGALRLDDRLRQPDWLIFGGESGPGARVADPQWARDIAHDCFMRDVAFFLKQWGTYGSNPLCFEDRVLASEAARLDGPENGKGGALLDGLLWRNFPN